MITKNIAEVRSEHSWVRVTKKETNKKKPLKCKNNVKKYKKNYMGDFVIMVEYDHTFKEVYEKRSWNIQYVNQHCVKNAKKIK